MIYPVPQASQVPRRNNSEENLTRVPSPSCTYKSTLKACIMSFMKNEGNSWTKQEDELLRKEIASKKYPLFMIAQRHERKFISIQKRVLELDLQNETVAF